VSPALAALQGSLVPVPPCAGEEETGGGFGAGAGGVTIVAVGGELAALPTKTRPKRLVLLASDGRWLTFLLKGREDLRQEARVMQVGGLGRRGPCAKAQAAPGAPWRRPGAVGGSGCADRQG
jgi:PI-3-kinase-related kinase SMG-1